MYKLMRTGSLLTAAAADAALARALRGCVVYVIPAAIAILTVLALTTWRGNNAAGNNLSLSLRVVAEDAATFSPASALARLRNATPVPDFDTQLAENPFWFLIDTVHRTVGPEVIAFPSRHAVGIACWDTNGIALLGAADRNTASRTAVMTLTPANAGFALRLTFVPAQLLCRARFQGPAHVTVTQWPAEQFASSVYAYQRKSGVLDGGMLTLALCTLIIAAIYRQKMYLILAGWLVLNLRIGGLWAGWDVQWLGHAIPASWLLTVRCATYWFYTVSTLMLYQMLVHTDCGAPRTRNALRLFQWTCVPMLIAALVLPYRQYVPIVWTVLLVGVIVLVTDLLFMLYRERTRIAALFGGAVMVGLLGAMANLLAALFRRPDLNELFDQATCVLVSSMLAFLATVEKARARAGSNLVGQHSTRPGWDASPAALFTLDQDGRVLASNPAFCTFFGCHGVASSGRSWAHLAGASAWQRLREQVRADGVATVQFDDPDSARHCEVRATLAHGRIEGFVLDITGQQQTMTLLQAQASTDPLTAVLNRRGLDTAFDKARRAAVAGRTVVIAVLQIGRFGLINDLYGLAVGDEVLRQVCERARPVLDHRQHIGRLGGDIFVIVMEDATLAVAEITCAAVRDRIDGTAVMVGDKSFALRTAVGMTEAVPGMSLADAVARADRACQRARCGTDDAAASPVAVERDDAVDADLVARLSSAGAVDGLLLVMQPLLALGRLPPMRSFEAVLRIRQPDGTVADATRMIAVAEKCGRTGVIDRWMLGATLDWIAANAAPLAPEQFVCLPLSGAALHDEQFLADLTASLVRLTPAPGQFCISIPKRVGLLDIEQTRRFVIRMRHFGIRVRLDDIGTGAAPVNYLQEIGADLVRIDRSLTSTVLANPASAAMVKGLVCYVTQLGMKSCATDVNDAATLRELARMGIHYAAGSAVTGVPVPAFTALAAPADVC